MNTLLQPLRHALLLLALCTAGAHAFDLQGHRGTRGNAPENTLAAFERALAIGVTTLELDIAITADNVAVISHDPFLNPAIARDGSGQWLAAKGPLIHSLTLAQLQTYDVGRINPANPYAALFPRQQPRDGQHIPTLASLFDLVKVKGANDVRFNIETKLNPLAPDETVSPEQMTAILLRTIADAGMNARVSIQSFDWRSLQIVHKTAPAIPTVYLTLQTKTSDSTRAPGGASPWTAGMAFDAHGSVPKMIKAAGGAVWSPNGGALTQALLKEAHDLGLQVIPWTINEPADQRRLLDWAVDGIITDYPDQLRELMRERGMALPAPR
jgi:glycerophosphoryl diester phosphodiesterase